MGRTLALSPFRIVFIYLAFGALWIVFSDRLLEALVQGQLWSTAQTVKGWLFVAVTAGLLYLLIKSYLLELEERKRRIERLNRFYRVLSGINSAIIRIRNRDALLDEALGIAVGDGGFALAAVSIRGDGGHRLFVKGGAEEFVEKFLASTFLSREEGSGAGQDHAKRLVINNISEGSERWGQDLPPEWTEEAIRRGYRSFASLPVSSEEGEVGSLALFSNEPDVFDDREIRLLDELSADISLGLETIAREEKLGHLAYHDVLTDLPNHALFTDRLSQDIREAGHSGRAVAVLMIGINRYGEIRTAFGQRVCDEVVREVAVRFTKAVRDGDTVSRVGGGEFAAALSGLADPKDTWVVINKLLRSLDDPVCAGQTPLTVTVSAGAALYPQDAGDKGELVKAAEASYRAVGPSSVSSCRFYSSELHGEALRMLNTENHLRKAVGNGELSLAFQPIVDTETMIPVSVEALLRWRNGELGSVSPSRFIPVAEESGLIVEIGRWVIRRTLAQGMEWAEEGTPLDISLNVSAKQLRDERFLEEVKELLKESRYRLTDFRVGVEITESDLVEDESRSVKIIENLRDLGLRVYMDDFGTGYSSLSYFKRLPVDVVKLDVSFIRDVTKDPVSASIVESIIDLTEKLGMEVVAEGVETEEQLEYLKRIGCRRFQGYLFSPPVDPVELRELWTGMKRIL